MAPKKRPIVADPSTELTRSSARLANTTTTTIHPPLVEEETPKAKKPKKVNFEEKAKNIETGEEESNTKIVIEHCKQCTAFKTRALMVKEGLEKGVPGVKVVINPEKPRRGCFEIREKAENGEKFISLLDMVRPFAPMKQLDMEKVVSDIVEKVK